MKNEDRIAGHLFKWYITFMISKKDEKLRSFHDIVSENARHRPEALYAYSIDQDKRLSYGELNSVGNRAAHFFKEIGVGRNQRVLLLSENSIESLIVFISTLRYGATLATVHVDMNEAHLKEIISAINPVVTIYQGGLNLERFADRESSLWIELGKWRPDEKSINSGFFKKIENFSNSDSIPSIAKPEDQGVIFYTSGTVAKPKGVIQTHATAYYNYDATADYLGLGPGVRTLDCRSFSWLSAQHMSLGAPLVAGATSVFANHFSRTNYFSWIIDYDINIGFVVPTMINMLINRPIKISRGDLRNLSFLTSSSAPLLEEQWRTFEKMYGIILAQSCGSSEGGNTAAHRGAERKIGTIGLTQKYQRIRIVNTSGEDLETGEIGEIIVGGGKQQALGYLNSKGDIETLPKDGHHTGDLGYFDKDGHLHITGRAKELIIRGGINISPVEVDSVLVSHPHIAEAGSFGVPHKIYGEEVAAFVVKREGVKLDEIDVLDHCCKSLPDAKQPKNIMFISELPKNSRGKLDRGALLKIWKNR